MAERGRPLSQYIQPAGAIPCRSGDQVGTESVIAGLPAGAGQHCMQKYSTV